WANAGFSGTPAATVVTIGANNYVSLPLGGYQVGNVASDSTGTPAGFNAAMFAALNNPAGYNLSYNWYVDTSTFTTPGTYLQLSSFVNAGSGYYAQTGTPSAAGEPQFDGTQVASGSVFSGTATVPFTAFSTDASAATENYFRLGLIINGDGTGVTVKYTDISVSPVPEPTTFALAGLGAAALLIFRRRAA
ncbi:MAG TPA: PEP-CTERM sorting domain-containing protein, partial [Verrucomicrobiae bacterium]|nr:PEP-CTERM sorting domain-containing protein [Verrucomicrobiae bacterium]